MLPQKDEGDAWTCQVPPQLLSHTVLGRDVAADRFLADSQLGTFIEHADTDLFGRPALLDPLNDALARIRMAEQFALRRTALQCALMCCHSEVFGVFFGKASSDRKLRLISR